MVSPSIFPLDGFPFVPLPGCSRTYYLAYVGCTAAGHLCHWHWWDLLGVFIDSDPLDASHLLHESAILRDQVCPGSNKGGCFDTLPLFAIYKPDPFDHTAHFSPNPLHLVDLLQASSSSSIRTKWEWDRRRLYPFCWRKTGSFSWTIVYVFWVSKLRLHPAASAQSENETGGNCIPSGGGKQVHSVERLFTFSESPNFVCEWSQTASTKGYSCFKGSGLYIAERGCVSKRPPFSLSGLYFCFTLY